MPVDSAFDLQLVTPERVVYQGRVKSLKFPAEDGLMGILPNHAPIVSLVGLGPAEIVEESGAERVFFVADGFFEMANNSARLLADAGESADEIDLDRVIAAEKAAKERLAAHKDVVLDEDRIRAERSLARALWRERIARRAGR